MALRFALSVLALCAGFIAAPAWAQQSTSQPWYDDPPTCTAQRAGQRSCQVSVLCECRYFPASAMEGTRAGYRWDCGTLRPRCGEALQPKDPTINPYTGPYPYVYEDGDDRDRDRHDRRDRSDRDRDGRDRGDRDRDGRDRDGRGRGD